MSGPNQIKHVRHCFFLSRTSGLPFPSESLPIPSESLPNASIDLHFPSNALQIPSNNFNSFRGIVTYQWLTAALHRKNITANHPRALTLRSLSRTVNNAAVTESSP